MATNKAKIGYDVIKSAKKASNNTTIIKWNKIPITVKRTLPLDEAAAFVASIVDACFDGTDGYAAENEYPAIRSAVIALYTNLELPANQFDQYELVYTEDLFNAVLNKININQLDDLIDAAEKDIEYRINADASSLRKKMEDFERTIDELTNEISDAFSEMTPEEMAETVRMISTTKMDEEKLMNAYINNAGNRGNGNAGE